MVVSTLKLFQEFQWLEQMFLLRGLLFLDHQIMSKLLKAFDKKFLSLLLIIFSLSSIAQIDATFINKNVSLTLIVSNTDATRRKGLMNKKILEKNTGMIFIWPSSKRQCMWMKDTPLPLSVAFISSNGRILEIYDMVPFSEESICSIQRARMAVEVNQGWFKKNNIIVGDTINF